MKKLLVVDDDNAMRGLVRMRLSDSYEVYDTGEPEQAISLALQHKPDAVLLDLMMPTFSGFELCQSLHALSYTAKLPIFVITGAAGLKYQEHCVTLGVAGYLQKPVDFAKLKKMLEIELGRKEPERRSEARVRMRVPLLLRGHDANGVAFDEPTETENVSCSGFLCACARTLMRGSIVEVTVTGATEHYVGRASVIRRESSGTPWQRYGFRFLGNTDDWVLQKPASPNAVIE